VISPQGPPGESNAAADVPRGGSRRRNLRIAAGLATVYALLLLADAALPGVGGRPRTVAAIRPHARIDNGPLWTAYTRCGAGKISDRGVSLYLDTAGDQWHSGDLRLADVACVLGVLRAPSSLLGAIAHGQQPLHWTVDADTFSNPYQGWYRFTATWTYDRATGLDMTITVGWDFDRKPTNPAFLLQLTGS